MCQKASELKKGREHESKVQIGGVYRRGGNRDPRGTLPGRRSRMGGDNGIGDPVGLGDEMCICDVEERGEMKKRIYIAGAIRGTNDYVFRFKQAETCLRACGWDEIINPAAVGIMLPKLEQKEIMPICIAMLSVCEHIFILNNSDKSPGVSEEKASSVNKGITIHYEKDGYPFPPVEN
ncbi:MAG: DUF4406 domain-containing protein [Oscillospiraceae bacterium]|nr:DUF4406 domain-containing protein [Oscillospiraceae bacterium]